MIGNTLSHYKIIEKLGQGGMGEVYLAEDSRLDRKVALKILPEHLSDRAELRERFEREARAVSSLNHPHICTLHDIGEQDGIHYLVMEHLVGETLEARLAKGPLPLEQTLEYAIQIADALDKAHRQGVVHRDLKPGNIMLVKSGAKLLDFGLAKLQAAETPTNLSALPTEQANLTAEGTILGTLQYMAPEQLEAKEADSRTDIFAFGAVVYETATGKKAFEGKSQASLIAAILKDDPPAMAEMQSMTPPVLDRVVKRCLAKEPDERWQTAADLLAELQWVVEGGAQPTEAVPSAGVSVRRQFMTVGLSVLAGMLVSALLGIGLWSSTSPTPLSTKRFLIQTPVNQQLDTAGINRDIFLSPDGKKLVLKIKNSDLENQLHLRPMDDPEGTLIRGTEGVNEAFFSPDGEWIAFFTGQQLKKVSLRGGVPITLCEVSSTTAHGSWGPGDTIIFGDSNQLFRLSSNGGKPEELIKANEGIDAYRTPQILPDGKAVLYTAVLGLGSGDFRIEILFLETGQSKVAIEDGKSGQYANTGHLIYEPSGTGTLMAVPFDLQALEVKGDPVQVLQGVRQTLSGSADYSLADDGTLVYVEGEGGTLTFPGKPVWVNRDGGEVESIVENTLEFPRYPRISPDGRRLAITTGQGNAGGLWVYDLGGQPPYPLSLEGMNSRPVWTPDGKKVAFSSGVGTLRDLFWIPADGSTLDPEPLLESNPSDQFPESWTPDGQELIFVQTNANGANDIMAVSPNEGEPRLVVQTQHSAPTSERGGVASLSPDGNWLAYVSAVTGEPEIWVRPYPGPGAPVRVSPSGGLEPVWSRDGHEVYYLEGSKMMAVKIEAQPELRPQPAEALFDGDYFYRNRPSYDVATDGRFLMIQPTATTQDAQIYVVLNWFEELKRLVPTDN